MIIKSIHIKNYKCFYDTGAIAFGPGFNFVLGKNDSGKSTLLEALGFPTPTVPHRSLKTIPNKGDELTLH